MQKEISNKEAMAHYDSFQKILIGMLSKYNKYREILNTNEDITILPVGKNYHFVYTDEKKNPVGILVLEKSLPSDEHYSEDTYEIFAGGVYDLSAYVKPEYRGRGITRKLLKAAEISIGVNLNNQQITKPALLVNTIAIPPSLKKLARGIAKMLTQLGYTEHTNRLFSKPIDPVKK